MFEIENISKKYNNEFALHDVSMTIGKGLNFIVGASGSGKTTLLKIISGMEQDFEGHVLYCGKNIKSLSTNEKGYFYNTIFGFVWQDFNLLEDGTVLENVLLPQYLKNNQSNKNVEKVLKELKILDIASQKVKYLSGGQKQRVAIARELMKDPQVIIADEPTSALDEKTSKTTMDILRKIAKSRMVIVVTHDTSLITKNDSMYELDKGEVVTKPEVSLAKTKKLKMQNTHSLSYKSAFSLAKINAKNKIGRFILSALTLVIASVFLLTTVSDAINNSGQGEFGKLLETYGESLLDISIIKSFTDASGTGGEENKKPDGTVSQNIEGLYDKYSNDERVAFMAYLQAFNDIEITLENKSYQVQSSNSTPVMNKLLAGNMPNGNTNEVVVPESFVQKLGISNKQAIGKEIDFTGSLYNWSTGQPVLKSVACKAKIVGVADTTATYEFEGQVNSYAVDDSFFFSKSATADMTRQANTDMENANFFIRAKTPADMIAIKDELSAKGIVPIGRFELVEDMVRLHNQTTEQSGSASTIIGSLSVVMVTAIFLITGFMRKKEYAIYKVSGFTTKHLCILNLAETISTTITAIVLLLVASPLLSFVTESLFGVHILDPKMLITGVLMIIATAVLMYFVTIVPFLKVNASINLKSGDR